jgi:hypothetical protein
MVSATATVVVPDKAAALEAHKHQLFSQQQQTEWAKARAKHLCWAKEKELVVEEMCQMAVFLMTRSNWWIAQKDQQWPDSVPTLQDMDWRLHSGLNVYAERQAALLLRLQNKFVTSWAPLLCSAGLASKWLPSFNSTASLLLHASNTLSPMTLAGSSNCAAVPGGPAALLSGEVPAPSGTGSSMHAARNLDSDIKELEDKDMLADKNKSSTDESLADKHVDVDNQDFAAGLDLTQ